MPSAYVGKCFKVVRPRGFERGGILVLALAAVAALGATAQAQVSQQGGERAPAVVIRGQVPIPQVVTIRPREIPAYKFENMLIPSRDYSEQLGRGYTLQTSRNVFGVAYDNGAAPVESIGAPPLPPLPPLNFGPLPVRYTTVKRQRAWCAPNWWCPKTKVQEPIVADFPADFPRRTK